MAQVSTCEPYQVTSPIMIVVFLQLSRGLHSAARREHAVRGIEAHPSGDWTLGTTGRADGC